MADQVPGHGVSWPELISRLLTPGPDRNATVDTALRAATIVSGASGVELVEWVRKRPSSVRAHGAPVVLNVRPTPGRE